MSLRRIEVQTCPPYGVHVGLSALGEVHGDGLLERGVFVLADKRAWELHGAALVGLEDAPRLEIAGGEEAKSLLQLEGVLDALTRSGLSRASTVITFGGGSISDLGGLAASLFKRGVDVVHCPTTLLAQVDASVGGKTAINLKLGKNLAGTVHQPRDVFADPTVLATLPAEEWASGLGEALKTALLGGEDSFGNLEALSPELAHLQPEATATLVGDCVQTKARIVAEDPQEQGPRRALNLGHTFAHAIEHCAGYGAIPHGVAVAVGVSLALEASAAMGLLEDGGLQERVRTLQGALGLPSSLADLRSQHELGPDGLRIGLAQDKKGAVDKPEFVLVRGLGDLVLGVEMEDSLLQSLID
ncbi:MAG: 3-dehydroquinate synthase family protein [Planctomycetota bacterium]|nr:3-dehydroquinate synthase family protein [Planctomycetota bacterium]